MWSSFGKNTALYNPEIIDPFWDKNVFLGRFDENITTDLTGLNTPSAGGSAAFNSTTKKWGGGSLYKPNGGSYLNIGAANNTNFQFGTGDFTLETWFYITAIGNSPSGNYNYGLWSANQVAGSTAHGWALLYRTAWNPKFSIGHWDGTNFLENSQTKFDYNTWTHLTCCRSGTTMYLGVNGNVQSVGTCSKNLVTTSTATRIGTNGYNEYNYTAYFDDFRVTKGVAKYTSNYVVPTKQWPTLLLP
jgi:hypothetical protein